ncbi:MAG: Ig-like domain-containing protein [Eubacterium sp.]|nr:Ig-like domain-containing protein [Eubacterium sp.]
MKGSEKMKNGMTKKGISVLLAVMLMLSAFNSAFYAMAEGGIIEIYEMEICYEDGTPVPDRDENGEELILSVMESEKLQLGYNLIGCNIPEGGYVRWYSETPTLVDVDQNGLVTAFDSSKGAVIQLWIDNEVKSVPLIGGIMGSMLENALFNDTVNVDSMDTDQIIGIIERLFGENSSYGSYTSGFVSSLKDYLKRLNCGIHAELCDENGNVLAGDSVKVLVTKSDKWYANLFPNGTHITNKESIETTVAVGSTVQLEALTTPKRLNYGVTYSVQSTSIFSQGGNIAEVDENGLVHFKAKGTVTVVASPRSEDVTKGLRDFMKNVNSLIANGDIDSDTAATILVDYLGVNINKSVVKGLIDAYIRLAQFSENMSGVTDAMANGISSLADNIMKYVYRDSITFTVVEAEPLEDFEIGGPDSVQEGSQIQLEIKNIVPGIGDTSDIIWTSSDSSIASVDEKTGTVTGRDAGGGLGALSSQSCVITATSTTNNVSKSVTVKVTGKATANYISDAQIDGPEQVAVGDTVRYGALVYPERNDSSSYLTLSWGIVTGTDSETGEPVYTWADKNNDVSDGIGSISNDGTYTSVKGGLCTIALKAVTGYSILGGYYEISSVLTTLDVQNDIPVNNITLSAENAGFLGNNNIGTLTVEEKELGGESAYYATVKINAVTPYYGRGAKVTANINPETATNADVVWHISNNADFYTENEKDKSIEVRARATELNSVTTQIWCETADGRVRSPIMTLTVTRNVAVDNKIDGGDIELEVDKDVSVTHTVSYSGNNTGNSNANHEASWYSSDESVFTVSVLDDKSGNAVISGVDVGTATVYCTSADGGITDSRTVTVYPNKDYLHNVIELCDKTVILKTAENKKLYNQYMGKLDKAYYVLYDVPMAAQNVCDTTADKLLEDFVALGGYVGVGNIIILDENGNEFNNKTVTVDIGNAINNYTRFSYDFEYKVVPENSMYSRVTWSSSNDSISVDKNGKCTPTSNNACTAKITCTIEDYLGRKQSDSAVIAFVRTAATGVTLNKYEIIGGEIGNTEQLKATVQPSGLINNASVNDVEWTSSDSSIASVDSDGTVHFLKGGDCVITVTTADSGYKAECRVNVITNYSVLQALVDSYDAMGLGAENYYPDTYTAFDGKMDEAKQMLSERTASQDEVDAMYNALVSSYNALKKYVYISKIEIYLDGEAASEYYQCDLGAFSSYSNAKLNLNVRLYPNNGSYESVRWESSTSFIKVNSDGVCSPTSNSSGYGKVTCTVTDHFGNEITDYVWVSFAKTPVTGITLSDSVISGKAGVTKQLTATVKPTGVLGIGDADIKDVIWSSDNESVATVNQNGLVTFVSAGMANITVTTRDGGYSAGCLATTLGDRSVLEAALEEYKNITFSDYEYDYGTAFKAAYSEAEAAMTDYSFTQTEIDSAATKLIEAASDLFAHPFVKIENINLDWTASDLRSVKDSGTVGSNDSIQLVSSSIAALTTSVSVKITPSVTPGNAMYSSISWDTVSSHNLNVNKGDDGTVTVKPTIAAITRIDAYGVLRVTYTDQYDRTYSRDVSVVIGKAYVTGIDITTPDFTSKATDAPTQLEYSLISSNGKVDDLSNKSVEWTSSDSSIASVDSNGLVTPLDEGTAVITAKTADGGYTDSVTVTVTPDYEILINAVNEYSRLVSESRGRYIYTEESLDVLENAVNDARPVAEAQSARQAVVNEKLNAIMNAYNALERYVPAEGLTLGLTDGETNAKVINEGFIRYTSTSLNGKSFKLKVNTIPAGSRYEQIEWVSDSGAVTVSADGTVTSTNSTSKAAKITCTITNYDNTSYSYDAYVSFVRYGVTGIAFDGESNYFGYNGESVTLSPTITYTDTTSVSSYYVNKCMYVSSDESIATVDNNGKVTFVSFGKATVTATTLDGGYTASVDVYTTNDTRGLRETLASARGITYTDYAYTYGIDFKNKYDEALSVYSNPNASQEEIDSADAALSGAMSALSGHPFIAPAPRITADGNTVDNNATVETDYNAQVTFKPEFADGAMLKSYTFNASSPVNATAVKNGDGSITVTRTAETGSLVLKLVSTDDYGREETVERSVKLVERLVPCTSVTLTANGAQISGSSYTYSCGGSYSNADLTIGYIPTPANANMIESVTYSASSTLNYVKIDSATGKVTVSGVLLLLSSYSATITCTVKNTDGSTVTKTVSLTVKKN